MVLLNAYLDPSPCIQVQVDNLGGAHQMTRHLLECGYQRLAFIAGPKLHREANRQDRRQTGYYLKNDLTVIVYNFIDMLSHARTEMEVLKEIILKHNLYLFADEAYREHRHHDTAKRVGATVLKFIPYEFAKAGVLRQHFRRDQYHPAHPQR